MDFEMTKNIDGMMEIQWCELLAQKCGNKKIAKVFIKYVKGKKGNKEKEVSNEV